MTARHKVERVTVLERAPADQRGGNTRHTRNIRHAHHESDAYVIGTYEESELWQDLVQVSGADINEQLARLTIHESVSCPAFMEAHGANWQPPLRGTLNLARTNRFFLGGGKALLNSYYATAEAMGVEICYDSPVVDLQFEGNRCTAVVIESNGQSRAISARSIVIASGGFEANLDWLEQYWGPAAKNFIVRGSRFNDGIVLERLLEAGARAIGDPKGFHAVAVDARSPRFDGGIVTRIDSVPFGIVVNSQGVRFSDEGQDLWPRRYASWGRLIAEQPGQVAYSLFDSKMHGRFIPGVNPPHRASTISGLATTLGLAPDVLERTVGEFNRSLTGNGRVDFSRLDHLSSNGLYPPKSNWAQPIDTPDFYAYPLRPGITFTYRGVEVDSESRVKREGGGAFDNVFAAGEVMAGNVLTKGYLAGIGLTIGTVFGRIAGRSAAAHAAS
jgi:tricarballylate dehydrogenase